MELPSDDSHEDRSDAVRELFEEIEEVYDKSQIAQDALISEEMDRRLLENESEVVNGLVGLLDDNNVKFLRKVRLEGSEEVLSCLDAIILLRHTGESMKRYIEENGRFDLNDEIDARMKFGIEMLMTVSAIATIKTEIECAGSVDDDTVAGELQMIFDSYILSIEEKRLFAEVLCRYVGVDYDFDDPEVYKEIMNTAERSYDNRVIYREIGSYWAERFEMKLDELYPGFSAKHGDDEAYRFLMVSVRMAAVSNMPFQPDVDSLQELGLDYEVVCGIYNSMHDR